MKFGGMFFSPCLSVCLSVHPSVHPSVHLSTSVCLFVCLSPVCGHDSKRWVHKFLWKSVHWLLTIIDVHLEFSYFSIYRLYDNNKKKCLKNYEDLLFKHWNVLFLNWNFYLLLWIIILLKSIANFYSEHSQWGRGCQIHFAGLTMYSGTMHLFDFLLLT